MASIDKGSDETVEMTAGSSFADNFFAAEEPTLDVEFAAESHIGNVRNKNEDHYAVIRRTRKCEMLKTNLPADDVAFVENSAWGLLVADGVGGARFGDFASQLVLETIFHAAGLATNWLMKFKDVDAQEVQLRIDAYVERIREAFRKHADLDPRKQQMGTTLTAAYLLPPHAIFAHIGDSRAYLIRDFEITQITRDHTLAQALIESGVEAEDVKDCGHVLINSLDIVRDEVVAEVMHVELEPGDRLLLCTDGLSDLVESERLVSIVKSHSPQEACDQLIQAALDEGGKDNITVIVCALHENS